MKTPLIAAFIFVVAVCAPVVNASNPGGLAENGAVPPFQTFLEHGEFRRTNDGRCVLEIRELEGLKRVKSEDFDLSIPVIRVQGVQVTCAKPYRPLTSQ